MKALKNILPEVLLSGLLADSPAKVASALGYAGRSTVMRIMEGSAGQSAVANFCKGIEEHFGISEDALRKIAELLAIRGDLLKHLKGLGVGFEDVMIALISGEYDALKSFASDPLVAEMFRIRRDDGELMSGILSICFFKDRETTLDELICALSSRFADNAYGKYVCELSKSSPAAHSKLPPRLKVIELGAYIIRGFYADGASAYGLKGMIALKGIEGRSYWRDENRIVLLNPVYIGDLRGIYYEFYYVDEDGGLDNPAQLVFSGGNQLCMILKKEHNTVWGRYELEEDLLRIKFGDSDNEVVMTRLRKEFSRSLQEIDASLTDDSLQSVAMYSTGIRLLDDVRVDDVEIGRVWVTVCLSNGRRKRIMKSA